MPASPEKSVRRQRNHPKGPLLAKRDDRNGSLGFEDKLWAAADLLRNNMDPAEYKHVVLGLIFLKYISDAFEERLQALRQVVAEPTSTYYIEDASERKKELKGLLEDRDEYMAENVFWVPEKARRRRYHRSRMLTTKAELSGLVAAPRLLEAILHAGWKRRGYANPFVAQPFGDES